MQEAITKIGSFFTTLALIFSYLFGFAGTSVSEGYELNSEDKLIIADALYAGQGLCFDGEYYYTSGSITALNLTMLAKWDKNFHKVKSRGSAVPKELHEKYGSNHIGGIDCANGYIYAPVEDDDYNYNFVLLFDCDTLEYTGKCYELTCDKLTDGIPWCAVDAENGYFYTSQFDHVTEILRYKLDTMEYIDSVALDTELFRIQGGSVYNGKLYLSYDVSHSVNEQVIAVDLATGKVVTEMERYLNSYDNEAEDILVYPMADGSLIHCQDYDKLLGVNIRHYAVSQ